MTREERRMKREACKGWIQTIGGIILIAALGVASEVHTRNSCTGADSYDQCALNLAANNAVSR